MATLDKYIVRYHHGGTLLRKGEVSYINGTMVEFAVDPDEICYQDLLGDIKNLGYDIEKSVNLFFIDGEGILKQIYDDEGIVSLVDQLLKQWAVNIYVEFLGVDNDMNMLETLKFVGDSVVDLHASKVIVVRVEVTQVRILKRIWQMYLLSITVWNLMKRRNMLEIMLVNMSS